MEHSGHVFGSFTHQTPLERKCELFLTSGACSDEIVLRFDDGNKLYVSENFLSYASPVFRAMFEHQFKESETREVEMKGKSFEDFQEFLLCLHPGKQKPIDHDNVLRMVDLAEDYQVEGVLTRCEEVLKEWLTEEHTLAAKTPNNADKALHVKTCLLILHEAVACGFDELITHAIKTIAKFQYEMFTGSDNQSMPNQVFKFGAPALTSNVMFSSGFATFAHYPVVKEDCKKVFEDLPEKVQIRLLLERLKICDYGQLN